ncbi:MAG: hypothetical protein GY865_01065 [candidate division Zixibacteria bacterium]|nr:hypothetical protein [candidate division Zixibacteria bacterium]
MAESHKERRNRIKAELIEQRGGQCVSCGYSKNHSALCFHHIRPELKSFNISGINLMKKRKILEAEVDKCEVYCLNCHAELHDKEGWVHENGKRTKK